MNCLIKFKRELHLCSNKVIFTIRFIVALELSLIIDKLVIVIITEQ